MEKFASLYVRNELLMQFIFRGDFFKALIFLVCFEAIDLTLSRGISLVDLVSTHLLRQFLTNDQNVTAFLLIVEGYKQ